MTGFWEQALEAYVLGTLLSENGERTGDPSPLKELSEWEFEGLKKEVEEERGGGIISIQYRIGGEDVFYINRGGLLLDLCVTLEPQGICLWDLAMDANVPPVENWRAFVEGFVAFYQAQRERLSKAEEEFREALQRKVEKARELRVAIQELFEGGEREWGLDLHSLRIDPPGWLNVKMKGRKTLSILFSYDDVAGTLAKIIPTLELVEGAIDDCEMPFNLYSSAGGLF